MPGKCNKCGTGFQQGVCPNCGKPSLASQMLQLVGEVATKEGGFWVGRVVDLAKERGLIQERAQGYNTMITLWEWGTIKSPGALRGYRCLTGRGRKMIAAHAKHKNALGR